MKKALKTALLMITLILIIASCVTTEKAEKSDKSGNDVEQATEEKLSKDSIDKYFKKNLDSYPPCFEKAYERGTVPSEIKYHIYYIIDTHGVVTYAEQDKKYPLINDPEFEKCIVTAVRKILYPKATNREDVKVSYPLFFRMQNIEE